MKTLLGAACVALAASISLPTVAAIGPIRRDRGPLFTDSKVVRILTNDNFDSILNATQTVWLVDFYSPWCPHCRQFGPQYEKAANSYAEASNVQFGAVDCTREKDVCNREDIYGYPAVKMYHAPPDAEEGITMPHVGHIYARDVAKWIEEQLTENGIKSGVDIEQMYPLPKRRSDTKEEFKFAEPVEPTHDDQADDIKLNRLRDAGTTVLFAFEDGFFMGTTVLEGERAAQLNEEEIVAYILSVYKFEELERGGVLSALWSSMGASAFSLMRHDTSPLFTKSFQVHSLSTANYDVVLRDKNVVWLIDYYAPWCPHCRHFAPDWDKVANFYAATDRVKVGAVDCTKNQEICNQENINGFPGVKIHHVPADSEASIMMPRGIKNTRVVIGWAEKLMEEHGMKSGVSAEDIAAQLKLLRNDRVAKDGAKGETVKYNDQALERGGDMMLR
ncbi:hypothetical protein BBJ29_001907 [Phytophthora kernoviae]|uniref:Thioredoxin domain-containing protein n=1 Tax=Phytophthora kernoviae TaxID=325452 RepID=A0A3R7GLV5_9STRA|nr:hypothetical protein BBJ29_001907 [Phytophthora kernoviae]